LYREEGGQYRRALEHVLPLRMAAFPDLMASEAILAMTSGLASKIMRRTPIGHVTRSSSSPSSRRVRRVTLLTVSPCAGSRGAMHHSGHASQRMRDCDAMSLRDRTHDSSAVALFRSIAQRGCLPTGIVQLPNIQNTLQHIPPFSLSPQIQSLQHTLAQFPVLGSFCR